MQFNFLFLALFLFGPIRCSEHEQKKTGVEINKNLLDKRRFAEQVAIVKSVQTILKDCAEIKGCRFTDVFDKPESLDAQNNSERYFAHGGHFYRVSADGKTHSIESNWGKKIIATDVEFYPRKDGLDPSGNIDKAIIRFLGLKLTRGALTRNHDGYQYIVPDREYPINTIGTVKISTPNLLGGYFLYSDSRKAWSTLKDEYMKEHEEIVEIVFV